MDREWKNDEIANWANGLRRFSRQTSAMPLRMLDVIQDLQVAVPEIRINFVEAPDVELPYAAAQAEPKARTIRYRASLMNALKIGEPHAREILLEEIAHIFLHQDQLTLNYFLGLDIRARVRSDVARKEREAKKFVWYASAPIEEVYAIPSRHELQTCFNMSAPAAAEYFAHICSIRAKIEGKRRELPTNVVEFSDALRKKYPLRERPGGRSYVSPTVAQPKVSRTRENDGSPEQFAARQMGYLPEACPKCQRFTLRTQSGCTVCESSCGYSEGCD